MKRDKREQTNPNHRHFLYCLNLIIFSLVTLGALSLSVWFHVRQRSAAQEAQQLQAQLDELTGESKDLYTEEEMEDASQSAREQGAEEGRSEILMEIQSQMQSGTSTASMLRSLFPDDIVVVSGGKYYFYPVLEEVAQNSYSADDFALGEDGRLAYTGSDAVRLQTGLDISAADGEVDWDSAAGDDIAFVMVKAGERLTADAEDGTGAGTIVTDEMLAENIAGASTAGLSAGAFWSLGAVTAEEAQEEADLLVELLSGQKERITAPVCVRVNVPAETDRTVSQGRAEWTEYITIVCDTLEEAGYTPMIGGSLASFVMLLDLEELETRDWQRGISNIGASLYFPYEFSMWQYSVTGAVQGVSTEVSLNALLTTE